MLTPLDRLVLVLLFLVPFLCGLVGAWLLAAYGTDHLAHYFAINRDTAFGGLSFGGMILGYALGLTGFGLLSRRLASEATHKRWVECLTPDPDYDVFRGGNAGELILMVLVPLERRGGGP